MNHGTTSSGTREFPIDLTREQDPDPRWISDEEEEDRALEDAQGHLSDVNQDVFSDVSYVPYPPRGVSEHVEGSVAESERMGNQLVPICLECYWCLLKNKK